MSRSEMVAVVALCAIGCASGAGASAARPAPKRAVVAPQPVEWPASFTELVGRATVDRWSAGSRGGIDYLRGRAEDAGWTVHQLRDRGAMAAAAAGPSSLALALANEVLRVTLHLEQSAYLACRLGSRFRGCADVPGADASATELVRAGFALIASDPRLAESVLLAGRRRFPDHPHVVANVDRGLCTTRLAQERYEAAIETCEAASGAVDPTGAVAHNLATARLALGQTSAAWAPAMTYFQRTNKKAKALRLLGRIAAGDPHRWPSLLPVAVLAGAHWVTSLRGSD